ncbi:MAG: YhjD/YihY/BrkB family envelope integrity protein, partial [Cyanobacteriota bacterium]
MVLKKIWEIILNIFSFLKEVFYQWQKDKAMEMGAAISYYTVFSLPPILIILITLTGWFFGQDAIEGKIVNQIKGIVGENVAVIIQ